MLYDFEGSSEGWVPVAETDEEKPFAKLRCVASTQQSRSRKGGLRIETSLPGPCGACVDLPAGKQKWYPFTHLVLNVYVPQEAPERVQLIVYVKDTDLYYYQHLRTSYLRHGAWTHISLDLSAESDMWEYRGHYKPWDGYCRQHVREFGVKFISDTAYEGPFYLDRVELRFDGRGLPQRNAIYNLRANSTRIARNEKFELSFNLARTYDNPFDPDEVEVWGHFRRSDGMLYKVPGFFYQGYLRRMEKGAEKLVPMGRSQWKIRFTPREAGTYQYYVEVQGNDPVRSETAEFTCAESDSRGFVRISKEDPHYFEFDDGSFYFPIGHNIAAVHDARARTLQVNIPASEGTYAYDRMLSRMCEAGENWGRIWMSPWSFGIEWTRDYDPHFRGLGRYNLLNAWRLDHVLRTAEENSIYIMLLFTAHGEIGDYESDFWGHDPQRRQGSPYWSRYGGPLSHPREWYTSPEALEQYKKKVRYIVARWGYSPAIMSWEVLNEPDLARFWDNQYEDHTYAELSARFVRKVASHIKMLDSADHLVTSGTFRYRSASAFPTLQLSELDFNTGHVFQSNLEDRLLSDLRYMQSTHKKIFLPTEAGLTPFAQDAETTALAIHRTLWSSYMTPAAGAAAPWWWVLIDRRDLYSGFGALRAFAEGEDRRGRDYQPLEGSVEDESEERTLKLISLGNTQRGFCWVYHPSAFTSNAVWEAAPKAPATVTVRGFQKGRYTVEIWDTYEGRIVRRIEAETTMVEVPQAEGGEAQEPVQQPAVVFRIPAFARDVACKIVPAATQ